MDGNADGPSVAGSGPGPAAVPDPAGSRLRLAAGWTPFGRLATPGMARLRESLEARALRPGNSPGRPGQPEPGVGGHQRPGIQPAGPAPAGIESGPGPGRLDPALRAGTAPRLRSPRRPDAPPAATDEIALLPAGRGRRIRSGPAPGGGGGRRGKTCFGNWTISNCGPTPTWRRCSGRNCWRSPRSTRPSRSS